MIYRARETLKTHLKKIREILRYGKLQNQVNQVGQLHGEMAGQVGTLNVQRWRLLILEMNLIFMVAVLI
jgi:hypothetical protein